MTASLAHLRALAERCADGASSPQVALMEMMIASQDAGRVEQALHALEQGPQAARHAALLATYREHRAGCARLLELMRSEPVASASSDEQQLAYCRALFDGLVAQSEEASVAFYSLGSAELLRAATDEVVSYLRRRGLLAPEARVLDVGCGIGRIAEAIAPWVRRVDGIDVSPRMVEVAARRTAQLANVHIAACTGRDFADFGSASQALVLCVDSFPYVVQGGDALVQALFAEAARVLAPAGHFVLLNFSYRDDLARDCADVRALAARHGFIVGPELGERPFSVWNGAAFVLRLQERAR